MAVVLAGGGGRRFRDGKGTHKLLAPWRGHPVAWWAVRAALEADIGPVWVVTGAADLAGVLPPGARLVPNPHWVEGQATSLRAAVAIAEADATVDALVVGLADQPMVSAGSWAAVAASPSPVAVATYSGRRANPVRLARAVWPLLPTAGDAGARVLMGQRPDLVEQVACDGNPVDIDTVEDLTRWN